MFVNGDVVTDQAQAVNLGNPTPDDEASLTRALNKIIDDKISASQQGGSIQM